MFILFQAHLFCFSLRYLKIAFKKGSKIKRIFKNVLNIIGLDTVKNWLLLKKTIFGVLTKVLDPQNFFFASEMAKNNQPSEFWEILKNK